MIASITIRNLDDDVKTRLRAPAWRGAGVRGHHTDPR